nr:MAG TPA: hypothetical protein [Caudoviricetes sp.]
MLLIIHSITLPSIYTLKRSYNDNIIEHLFAIHKRNRQKNVKRWTRFDEVW